MNRTELIDHLKAGRPVNAKIVKEIVAEMERKLAMQSDLDLQGYEHMRDELLELKTALAPLVEWYNKSKRDFPGEFKLRDVVLQYEGSRGDVNVTSKQLAAIARLVGEE